MPGLWIEYHTALRDFWKIKRLAAILSVPYPHALGLVSCLWTWAAENKPDGNLKKFSDEELAEASKWDGQTNGFVGHLKACELLDADGGLHDWQQHGIRMLLNSRERQQAYRERETIRRRTKQRAANTRWKTPSTRKKRVQDT